MVFHHGRKKRKAQEARADAEKAAVERAAAQIRVSLEAVKQSRLAQLQIDVNAAISQINAAYQTQLNTQNQQWHYNQAAYAQLLQIWKNFSNIVAQLDLSSDNGEKLAKYHAAMSDANDEFRRMPSIHHQGLAALATARTDDLQEIVKQRTSAVHNIEAGHTFELQVLKRSLYDNARAWEASLQQFYKQQKRAKRAQITNVAIFAISMAGIPGLGCVISGSFLASMQVSLLTSGISALNNLLKRRNEFGVVVQTTRFIANSSSDLAIVPSARSTTMVSKHTLQNMNLKALTDDLRSDSDKLRDKPKKPPTLIRQPSLRQGSQALVPYKKHEEPTPTTYSFLLMLPPLSRSSRRKGFAVSGDYDAMHPVNSNPNVRTGLLLHYEAKASVQGKARLDKTSTLVLKADAELSAGISGKVCDAKFKGKYGKLDVEGGKFATNAKALVAVDSKKKQINANADASLHLQAVHATWQGKVGRMTLYCDFLNAELHGALQVTGKGLKAFEFSHQEDLLTCSMEAQIREFCMYGVCAKLDASANVSALTFSNSAKLPRKFSGSFKPKITLDPDNPLDIEGLIKKIPDAMQKINELYEDNFARTEDYDNLVNNPLAKAFFPKELEKRTSEAFNRCYLRR